MPSIAPRPMHLLVPQDTQQQGEMISYDCNNLNQTAPQLTNDDSFDNRSEVSDTSTFTSSPKNKPTLVVFQEEEHEHEHEHSTTEETKEPERSTSSEEEEDSRTKTTTKDSDLSDDESSTNSTVLDSEISDLSTSSAGVSDAALAPADVAKPQGENNSSDTDIETGIKALTTTTTTTTTQKSPKKAVGFEPLSTLYLFDDDPSGKERDDFYDVARTWYSSQELKTFRADAFLTVNWMVMKNAIPSQTNKPPRSSPQHRDNKPKNADTYSYYSNKYKYNRQKEIQTIAKEAAYEFCERGVECRTPLGRFQKNKRRTDALRVVMLYQQMQKQHRRERRREQRRRERQNSSGSSSNRTYNSLFHKVDGNNQAAPSSTTIPLIHRSQAEAQRKIEADIDAVALSNVYGTYCDESASEALARGQSDAIAIGIMPRLPACGQSSSLQTIAATTGQETTLRGNSVPPNATGVDCPSLCDDLDHDDDDDDDEGSTTSTSSSMSSDNSLCLEDLTTQEHDDCVVVGLHENLDESEEIEVEFVEGIDDQHHSHRILNCSSSSLYHKSWSHPEWKSSSSCPTLPAAAVKSSPSLSIKLKNDSLMPIPPTSKSFSSLELGRLFTGLDWW